MQSQMELGTQPVYAGEVHGVGSTLTHQVTAVPHTDSTGRSQLSFSGSVLPAGSRGCERVVVSSGRTPAFLEAQTTLQS